MVGYAYSADNEYGYDYISIKSYDCDDISFVNEATSFQIYRVARKNLSVELLYPNQKDALRHLQYNNIIEICQKLIRAEFSADYPVSLLWAINPSGVCEVKAKEDFASMWPLSPRYFETDSGYVDITDVFFNTSPLYLKSSFVADVINEAAYCCGICVGSLVTISGDRLFCTIDMACLAQKLFKSNGLLNIYTKFQKVSRCAPKNISRRRVLSKIKRSKINLDYSNDFPAKELCVIKSECIFDVICALEFCLKNNCSAGDFAEKLKSAFDKAFNRFDLQKANFSLYSAGKAMSDINYLTFNDLLMTFSFGEFKKEMADKIKINRQRKHALKEQEIPKVIYKGKLFFKL